MTRPITARARVGLLVSPRKRSITFVLQPANAIFGSLQLG
jgi:hypothetical protein